MTVNVVKTMFLPAGGSQVLDRAPRVSRPGFYQEPTREAYLQMISGAASPLMEVGRVRSGGGQVRSEPESQEVHWGEIFSRVPEFKERLRDLRREVGIFRMSFSRLIGFLDRFGGLIRDISQTHQQMRSRQVNGTISSLMGHITSDLKLLLRQFFSNAHLSLFSLPDSVDQRSVLVAALDDFGLVLNTAFIHIDNQEESSDFDYFAKVRVAGLKRALVEEDAVDRDVLRAAFDELQCRYRLLCHERRGVTSFDHVLGIQSEFVRLRQDVERLSQMGDLVSLLPMDAEAFRRMSLELDREYAASTVEEPYDLDDEASPEPVASDTEA